MRVDLHDDGVLWLINRVVFHPRGFALGHTPGTEDFVLLGDGSEPWRYASEADLAGSPNAGNAVNEDEAFAQVEALFARARAQE
jgi:hypothetical protein